MQLASSVSMPLRTWLLFCPGHWAAIKVVLSWHRYHPLFSHTHTHTHAEALTYTHNYPTQPLISCSHIKFVKQEKRKREQSLADTHTVRQQGIGEGRRERDIRETSKRVPSENKTRAKMFEIQAYIYLTFLSFSFACWNLCFVCSVKYTANI